MNQAILQQYLAQYKKEFPRIHSDEIYKWQAVQQFQKSWKPDAVDFVSMLTDALSKTLNLLDSGLYFPRRMVVESAEASPELVRAAFLDLYDEAVPLQERVDAFQKRLKKIVHTNWPEKNHYQDHRAILVYLSLRYPDIHYFYKYGVLQTFCERAGYDYKPVGGRFANVEAFYEICESVKKYILADPELRMMHFARLSTNDYPDSNFNILAQDFLFAINYYLTLETGLFEESSAPLIPKPAQAVLQVLVNHIQKGGVLPDNPNTFIGYKQVHDSLDLPMQAVAYGQSLLRQGLGELAEWTKENDFPAITGLIIDWGHMMPGPGYYNLFEKSDEDFAWWENEIRKSMEFDWTPYLEKEPSSTRSTSPATESEQKSTDEDDGSRDTIPDFFESSLAADLAEPEVPERVESISTRIVRDTKKAIWVKSVHDYCCQICGETIDLIDRYYSEAHHIKPLGNPHNGPDVIENIISVCPNHHAMLDYGALTLDMITLKQRPAHRLNPEYIDYHNTTIYKGN